LKSLVSNTTFAILANVDSILMCFTMTLIF
jgi:hypothetical protein